MTSQELRRLYSGSYQERFVIDREIKKLAIEILARAASDLLGGEDGYRQYKTTAKKMLQKDAAAWFESNGEEWIFSFISICKLIGIHPDWIRRRIEQEKIYAVRRSISMGRDARGKRKVRK